MTLPFSDKNERKYVCFVCGKTYAVYEDFKTHIIANHELTTDYVVCPVCEAPIRDQRSHIKAKHKHITNIQFTGPSKAEVWRDQDGKPNKKKTKRFREGYFFSQKNQKDMHYRSSWECKVYELLEELENVIKYDVEPFKVPYLFEGISHMYNPDLSVLFSDGHIEVWEIKPMNQKSLPVNHAKWLACDALCKNRGWQFVVMTENGINKLRIKVHNQ